MTAVIRPLRTIPARKSAGSLKRSDRSIALASCLGVHRVTRRTDLVSDAPHGHDRRRVAELAPHLSHVDVDGARVTGERVAPDALEQLVARQDEAAVVEQLPEEIELLRRELDLLVADLHLSTARIDDEVAVLDRLALPLLPLRCRAAEDRL